MDRSVDSIGTCSLDVEASAEISDWSEGSSAGTLRSASLPTPSPEPRLPSYLSLACTVNGYSTTTNYDPDRLARSRDTSPHRPNEHAQDNLTFTVHNNLLSPPNLVPLPNRRLNILRAQKDTKNMAEHTTMTHRQEFYSSSKMTYISSESKNFISNLYSSDLVDSCIENGFMSTANKCVTSESNMTVTSNGQSKTISEKVQEYSNGSECKSFIQQRVERLYGPGALAQGFFVMKRQKNKCHETEHQDKSKSGVKTENDKHSKSMNDQLLHDDFMEAGMKQSTSSPTLPVLRHLRPEFRAQLPILASKKGNENGIQKSVTVPTLIDEVKVNGQFDIEKQCVKAVNGSASLNSSVPLNGNLEVCDKIENNFKESQSVVKDGHYFLNVLDKEVQRLLVMAEKAEIELETPDLPEEAKGYLRSASGKARLLVSQKMQQFKGLCTNNLTQVAGEAFPTTNEDLQGFWDMVMLQVDQIDDLYKELDVLRTNNWQEKKYSGNGTANGTSNKPRKIKVNRPVSAVAEENRKQREAQRKKMIEDKRKAMREQTKQPRQSIEIFVPESS